MTYRAAYLAYDQSAGVVMTLPEHAHLSDEALTAEAVAEGMRQGLDETEVRDLLVIGDWND